MGDTMRETTISRRRRRTPKREGLLEEKEEEKEEEAQKGDVHFREVEDNSDDGTGK